MVNRSVTVRLSIRLLYLIFIYVLIVEQHEDMISQWLQNAQFWVSYSFK